MPKKNQSHLNYKFIILLIVAGSLLTLTTAYAKLYGTRPQDGGIAESNNLPADQGLIVRSVDTQIVSKNWQNTSRDSIASQVSLIKNMGANFVAISTPYDQADELSIWADEIHKAGLHVWFRSHWLNWEGDQSSAPTMTSATYLSQTSDFIKSHPSIFKSGDAFTVCVEPEQIFVVKKTKSFDADSYNKFLIDQIDTADKAFAEIDMGGKVYTNWISLNGWVVLNGLQQSAVDKMGVITVDHYPDQSGDLTAEESALKLSNDLKSFYQKWHKPIILGEWGYNIQHEVLDTEQSEYVQATLNQLSNLNFLLGLNYWDDMGNTARLINDTNGKITTERPAAQVLTDFYDSKIKILESKPTQSSTAGN